jgi:predicted metal-dependent hydrolase
MNTLPNPRIIRSHRRSLALQVLPNAEILVKAPYWMPDGMIQRFLLDNHAWIEKRILQKQQVKTLSDKMTGDKILYLGNLLGVKVGNYSTISLDKDHILFPEVLQFRLKKELSRWYIQQAKATITRLVERLAQEMDVEYKSISFSDTKSRWGSCSHDNHLQFNWRLVMAPLLVVQYVIIHELAHITEKNHSMDFWRRVGKFNPSYRQNRKWLKEHGDLLFAQV